MVSVGTLGSRVLGMLRDMLIFATFGVGPITSAFVMAFTIPNLFRRLFGEGALTSAFVPVFASELERGGRPAAFAFLRALGVRLFMVLAVLCVLAMAFLVWALSWPDLELRYELGARLCLYMMPYMLMICLAAILCAALNVLQRFAVAALTGVWLNLAMIVALGGFGMWLGETDNERVMLLAIGVLCGGLLQFCIPAWALRKEGLGREERSVKHNQTALRELFRLFLPGIVGAGIFQINIVVSRWLAYQYDDTAAALLFLPNRLVEFTLGVFAIAITTVVFPRLAALVARQEFAQAGLAYGEGLRLIFAITLPAMLGLILLREPILTLLAWGDFDARQVSWMTPVLAVFALALPLYALATYLTRGFHALKDTRSPVRVAGWTFLANVASALLLMPYFGAPGLAGASVISTLLQVLLLYRGLKRKQSAFSLGGMQGAWWPVALASVMMGTLAGGGWWAIGLLALSGKLAAALAVGLLVPLCVLLYVLILWRCGFRELELLREGWRRRRAARASGELRQ